mmetsp:Transcript_16062/g.42417  ORF Transcript_16062/g.42417 Transcript_16062/m.42417 type:complete len:274 (-) Transcript_16062:876-1697(-)
MLLHVKEIINLEWDWLQVHLARVRVELPQKAVPLLDPERPIVGVRLDQRVVKQDHLDVDVAQPALAQRAREELGGALGTGFGDVLGHGENAQVAAAPDPVLRKQPRKQDQEATIVNHPPDVNRSMNDLCRNALQTLHCQYSLVGSQSCLQDLHEVLFDLIGLRVLCGAFRPLQQHGVGDQATNACQLDDVVRALPPCRCHDNIGEALDAFFVHDASNDRLLIRGHLHCCCISRVRLQYASHHAEPAALAELGRESEDLMMLDASKLVGKVDLV